MVVAIRAEQAARRQPSEQKESTPLGTAFTQAIKSYVDYADDVGQRVARDASTRINGAIVVRCVHLLSSGGGDGGEPVRDLCAVGVPPAAQAGRLFSRIARRRAIASSNVATAKSACYAPPSSACRTAGYASAVRLGVEEIHTGSRSRGGQHRPVVHRAAGGIVGRNGRQRGRTVVHGEEQRR